MVAVLTGDRRSRCAIRKQHLAETQSKRLFVESTELFMCTHRHLLLTLQYAIWHVLQEMQMKQQAKQFVSKMIVSKMQEDELSFLQRERRFQINEQHMLACTEMLAYISASRNHIVVQSTNIITTNSSSPKVQSASHD